MNAAKNIKLAGANVPIYFGSFALANFAESENLTLAELFSIKEESVTFMFVLKLAYCGVFDGARIAKTDAMPFEDFCDALDQDPEAMTRIMEVYQTSVSVQKKTGTAKAAIPKPEKK